MDIELIKVPKAEAAIKLEAYKKRLRKMKMSKANQEVAEEYKAAVLGYEALENGTPLLDLDTVFSEVELDEKWRPKLAICRADRKQVRFYWSHGSTRGSFICAERVWRSATEGLERVVTMGRINEYRKNPKSEYGNDACGYSIVPIVPADVRPKFGQLKDWYVLWEVEQWADDKIQAKADRDPYLLSHLGGSLYAVVAEWDLTDLERAIMKGRVS